MKVLFDDLELALYNYGGESSYWVDKKTGRVIFIVDEAIVGEIEYDDDEEAEAEREIKILCGEIEAEDDIKIDENRYVEVEPPYSGEKWKWMEEFTVFQVEDEKAQNKLANALRGGKPFSRFKNALTYYPEVREKWFEFERKKLREYVEIWAEAEKIEIDFNDIT